MKNIVFTIVLILGINIYANALPGNALYFDGINDYVSISDNDDEIFANRTFTIETWVRWEAATPSVQFICGKGYEQMEIHTTANNGIRFIPTTGVYLDVDNVLTKGKWTHIAVVYNPSQSIAKIYINAKEKKWSNGGYNPVSTIIENTSSNFYIGQRTDETFRFVGAIDEFSIFKIALDQFTIQQHVNYWYSEYNNDGIVNLFEFDQGTAGSDNTGITTLEDKYEGLDGTLHNFALTGSTSNFIESYAKVIPYAEEATNLTSTSFEANWMLTENGEDNIDESSVENYQLYVASDSLFTNMLSGYPVNLVNNSDTSHKDTVTGVDPTNNIYYYRVTADATGFEGQGAYSNTVRVGRIFEVSPTNILLDYTLGNESTFQILADKEWKILNTPAWLTLSSSSWFFVEGDQLVTATTVAENNTGANRKASLTLTSDGMANLSVEVIQSSTPPDNALNFDGSDDYVQLENTFQPTSNLTIEAWVYWEGNNSTNQFIFKNGNSSTSGYALLITADGKINGMCSGKYMMTADTSLTPNIWQHVALVRNASTWTLYLNGNAQTLEYNTTSPIAPNGDFTIGAAENGTSCFNGSIDEFRVWNTARTEDQIKSTMYSILTGNETALYSYYKFKNGIPGNDNVTLTRLYDEIGNNHGTLNNFTLSSSESNWIESYAMVVPEVFAPSDITPSYFTINWTAPVWGVVDNYELEIASDSSFTNLIEGYNPLVLANTETTYIVSGLDLSTKYYYRLRANKLSVNGQGSYSAIHDVVLETKAVPLSKWCAGSIFLLLGLMLYIKKAKP